MKIDVRYKDDVVIISVSGGTVINEERISLADTIATQVKVGYLKVILKFEKVEVIDAVVMGGIAFLRQLLMAQGGDVVLAEVSSSIRGMVRITTLCEVIVEFDSEKEALAHFTKEG